MITQYRQTIQLNLNHRGRFFDPLTLPSLQGAQPLRPQSSCLPQTPDASHNNEVYSGEIGHGGKYQKNISVAPGVDLVNGSTSNIISSPIDHPATPATTGLKSLDPACKESAQQDDGNTRPHAPTESSPISDNAVNESLLSTQPGVPVQSVVDDSSTQPNASVESLVNLPAIQNLKSNDEQIPANTIIKQAGTLPLTSDEADSTSVSVVTTLASQQLSSDPPTIQLSSKEIQESRLNQAGPEEDISSVEEKPGSEVLVSKVSDRADINLEGKKEHVASHSSTGDDDVVSDERQSTPHPSSYRYSSTQNPDGESSPVHAGSANVPKPQFELARLEAAFAGTPSTPDEQLRLEEAQSMQHSKLSSGLISNQDQDQARSQQAEASTSASSLFVHGDFNEDEANGGAQVAMSDTVTSQHIASNKGYDECEPGLLNPATGLSDHAFSGMAGGSQKDLTLSRRPPMRIDTGVPYVPEPKLMSSKKTTTPSSTLPYTPVSSSTPHKSASSGARPHSPPERMMTRVSSGVLRHKSVSEILGETPKTASQSGERSPHDRASNDSYREDAPAQTSKATPDSALPDPAAFKQRLNELRENQRSKLSTVIFARQQPRNSSRYLESAGSQRSEINKDHYDVEDYFRPLFAMQASAPPLSHQLHTIVTSAHKTLTTSNHCTDFREYQDRRILERIYQLQCANRWSLRQLERSVEPDRPTTHWDVLLSHMKWLRTDFREERKWKIAGAKGLADSCAEWVMSSGEERKSLQVRVRSTPGSAPSKADSRPISAPTPDLVPSTEDDSSVTTDVDTPHLEISHGSAPAAIFSLPPEVFSFGVDKTPVTDKLLLELPLYQPSIETQDAALGISKSSPDSIWKTPLIPLSKFAQGKIHSHDQGPPRKRSRYNYQDINQSREDDVSEHFPSFEPSVEMMEIENEDVALFNPENKHIRDRIHAGHAFRPPSEHVMPSQSFFESRQSSQWTQGEDDELRRLVREYAYNWSLISSCLSSPSMFASGAERRTPWECFERWIGLEGLPAEMSKTQYFRAYHLRLQAAQRTHEAQQQVVQQNQGGSNTPHLPVRRRTTQPYLVDRRKNDKHLRLVDAMRKLAKKRETALHKQQHGRFSTSL